MTDRKRFAVRHGFETDDGPYEGVPSFLLPAVSDWVMGRLMYRDNRGRPVVRKDILLRVVAGAQANVVYGIDSSMLEQLLDQCRRDELRCLAIVDETLRHTANLDAAAQLELHLRTAGSVWTVADDGRSLEKRVDETAKAAFRHATKPTDRASDELRQAWRAAYGREPDASDAWDHTLKALEWALIPIIVPNMAKATLGDVVGQLRQSGVTFDLETKHKTLSPIDTLHAMLRLLWVNPDRHGGDPRSRQPSQEEAEALLHLAVTIVQWVRAGVIRK